MRRSLITTLEIMLLGGMVSLSHAAGMLTPRGAGNQPMHIREHHVNVVLNNGFAMTEVSQTFFNPNDRSLEAIYTFPLPQHASLSEVTIFTGEKESHGEVLATPTAQHLYQAERDQGRDAGLASKRGFQAFDFAVSPVPARGETRVRFVYYQPLAIDTGVGHYLYPLADGGTDEAGARFWQTNTKVEHAFSFRLELKSASPVADVRLPGFETAATITRIDAGHYTLHLQLSEARLERDVVFYYRLQDNLPGRIELIPYRPNPQAPGTFMLVVTPGVDLQPLNRGADYTFVLDVSGSMQGKMSAMTRGIVQALGAMRAEDRVRLIAFNHTATELTRGWVPATAENVARLAHAVDALHAHGSTNLYAGLDLALNSLDDDRATSIVLITDGVTNTGRLEPRDFHRLMQRYDVRVFGFLMGNSANWPLMRTITEASGGFYASVSNDDDIIGQVMLAKGKVTLEALHNVTLKIAGVKVSDVTDSVFRKVYRGQQLVIFGRYAQGGEARLNLTAHLTGADKTYSTRFAFPEQDTAHPEIERLWALARIEQMEAMARLGTIPEAEAEGAIRDLGLAYQLVTDYTSMVVLSDEAFAERGIERRNQARLAQEHQARALRAQQPARSVRVDQTSPAFQHPAPTVGGGAVDPLSAGMALSLAGLAVAMLRRQWASRKGQA